MIELRATTSSRAMLLGIAVGVSSCGGSDLALPSDAPAVLEIFTGQSQAGTVGTALPESLVVRVTDAGGAGLAGVRVEWTANGGGSASPSTSITDSSGLAATERMLGAAPGAYGTAATARVTQGSPAVFLATAIAGAPDPGSTIKAEPAALTASTGNSSADVTVTVHDEHGNPVPGVTVKLSATGSGNKITQPSAPTNQDGTATGRFSATGAGSHALSASAGGVKISQTVTVTVAPAMPDADRGKVIVPDGTAGASTLLTVRLRDQFGNEVSGVRSQLAISVSGANPTGTLSISEEDGAEYTTRYTPTVAGIDAVQVTYDGASLFGGPFHSTVVAGPAAPGMTVAVVDGTATVFAPNIDISVQVRDAYGNPTRRANENVSVTASGDGERRSVRMDYDAGTAAYVGSFRPWAFGAFQVEIMVNGQAIPGSPFTAVLRAY